MINRDVNIVRRRLYSGFIQDGYLEIGQDDSISAIFGVYELFLVTEKSKKKIHTIGDLKGHVNIKSKIDVLSFSMLLTSPSTHMLFHGKNKSKYIDIINRSRSSDFKLVFEDYKNYLLNKEIERDNFFYKKYKKYEKFPDVLTHGNFFYCKRIVCSENSVYYLMQKISHVGEIEMVNEIKLKCNINDAPVYGYSM